MRATKKKIILEDLEKYPNDSFSMRSDRLCIPRSTIHYVIKNSGSCKEYVRCLSKDDLEKDIELYPDSSLVDRGQRLGVGTSTVSMAIRRHGLIVPKFSRKLSELKFQMDVESYPLDSVEVRAKRLGVSIGRIKSLLNYSRCLVSLDAMRKDIGLYPDDDSKQRAARLGVSRNTIYTWLSAMEYERPSSPNRRHHKLKQLIEEDAVLYPFSKPKDRSNRLGITIDQYSYVVKKFKTSYSHVVTLEQVKLDLEMYPASTKKDRADRLGCSVGTVHCRLKTLGWVKPVKVVNHYCDLPPQRRPVWNNTIDTWMPPEKI